MMINKYNEIRQHSLTLHYHTNEKYESNTFSSRIYMFYYKSNYIVSSLGNGESKVMFYNGDYTGIGYISVK